MELKEIGFRQLCALVKAELLKAPDIDDAEWKARVQDRMAKWGFLPANPTTLSHALMQVEQAVKKTLGPRPVRPIPLPPTPAPKDPPPPEPTGRTNRPAGWDLVVALMAKLQGSRASAPSLQPPPRETLTIDEYAALDEFWRACREEKSDKLALLRAFAEIAIVRPADWDYVAVRAESKNSILHAQACFACGADGDLHWHHIIQIQHGGSNYLRNRVAICAACHGHIHPWLPLEPSARRTPGWSHIGSLAPVASAVIQRKRDIA